MININNMFRTDELEIYALSCGINCINIVYTFQSNNIILSLLLNSVYKFIFLLKFNISFYYEHKYKTSLFLTVLVTLLLESHVILITYRLTLP